VWERRYGIIQPVRGSNRYRIYTDEDVALLRYLRAEMEKGNSIGDLSALGRDELLARMRITAVPASFVEAPFERLLGDLIAALDPIDRVTFERRLGGAVAVIPFEEALHKILLPLQERVGQLWHDGRLGVAVEHYVTKQVQQKLFSVMNQLQVAEQGPKMVVACPPGEAHEIAAQTVAYTCAIRGCRVYYLGPDVPVASLASFCAQVRPDMALLSLSGILSQEETEALARDLSAGVTPLCPVAAGGVGAQMNRNLLEQHHIEVLDDIPTLERRVIMLLAKRSVTAR
jgi:DNA-binding transcriptional MerR regulator